MSRISEVIKRQGVDAALDLADRTGVWELAAQRAEAAALAVTSSLRLSFSSSLDVEPEDPERWDGMG